MIRVLVIVGALASMMMYIGDLLLYFSAGEYNKSTDKQPLNKIMSTVSTYKVMSELSKTRIAAGSLLGVFAGFFWCDCFFSHLFVDG